MADPSPTLVPLDCDLRDFQWMPVDIVRLFGSNFHAQANDSEWRAGVTLWLKSYHQVPAASLPDDDAALARLAELGRDQKTWRKLRPAALHGWVKCDDGRLYHKVVSEKALEAWIDKLQQRKVSAAGNAKRWGGEASIVEIELAADRAVEMLRALNPNSRTLAKRSRRSSGTDGTGSQPALPVPPPQETQQDANGTPVVIPSGSQGTRTEPNGEKKEAAAASLPAARKSDAELDSHELAKICLDAAGITNERMVPSLEVIGPVSNLLAKGWRLDAHVLPVLRSLASKGKYFRSWKLYAQEIVEKNDPIDSPVPSPPKPAESFMQKREDLWTKQLAAWKKYGNWSDHWGAGPGNPSCEIPPEFVAAFERKQANGAHS